MTNVQTGLFIAIEGSDGTGKSTQHTLLAKRLATQGYNVALYDFPQYQKPSSYFVKEYLRGSYGQIDGVGPYTASLFYALDRFEAAAAIRRDLTAGKVVLANRYSASNLAHQGSKIQQLEDRRAYYIWLDNLEFRMLNIPRPDISLILHVPVHISETLVRNRPVNPYKGSAHDIHESDNAYLRKTVAVYEELCHLFPKDYHRVDCARNNQIMPVETIHELLYKTIEPHLSPAHKKQSVTAEATESVKPSTMLTNDSLVVGSVSNEVQIIAPHLAPLATTGLIVKAAVTGDDLRELVNDAVMQANQDDATLHQNSLVSYESSAVRQMASTTILLKNPSVLAAEQLATVLPSGSISLTLESTPPWQPRLGTEQFYIPNGLSPQSSQLYIEVMQKLFRQYSLIQDSIAKGAARGSSKDVQSALDYLLPVSQRKSVIIHATYDQLEHKTDRLRSNRLPEVARLADLMTETIQKTVPNFMRHKSSQKDSKAWTDSSDSIQPAATYGSASDKPVRIISAYPKNESELIVKSLYQQSEKSLPEARMAVDALPYIKKMQLLSELFAFSSSSQSQRAALEYELEIVSSYELLLFLYNNAIIKRYTRQSLTPRYGYYLPDSVEQGTLAETFESCYALSLDLYNLFKSELVTDMVCEYTCLRGHKVRYIAAIDSTGIAALIEKTSNQNYPELAALADAIMQELAIVSPLFYEYLTSVT